MLTQKKIKPYKIGFTDVNEPIIIGLRFIVDCIIFYENDIVDVRRCLSSRILNIDNIDIGIKLVETLDSYYLIFDCSKAHPLWLNLHPAISYPSLNAQELDWDYNCNPPELTKKAFVGKKTIESFEQLYGGIFKIFTNEGETLFGI